jgi:hypothetical protein
MYHRHVDNVQVGTDQLCHFGPLPTGTLLRALYVSPVWTSGAGGDINVLLGLFLGRDRPASVAALANFYALCGENKTGGNGNYRLTARLAISKAVATGFQYRLPLNIELDRFTVLAIAMTLSGAAGESCDLSYGLDAVAPGGKNWRL